MPLTAVTAPVYAAKAPADRQAHAGDGVQVFGRLVPRVTLAEAEAQLSGVAAALPGGAAAGESALRVRLDPHAGLGRASSSDTLAIAVFVFAVIGLVLLLACANVATVLISTAITREREMGVRAALGASRGRIVRQLVTESLALGTIAAAIGLVFAYWAIPMIGTMIEAPAGADLAPDVNVYLFLGIVTLVTGVGAGLAPAWHGRGADLVTPLKGEGARQNRVAPRRLRSLLVMTQAAVSVLLIVMATLFVRATFRAATIDVGFEADGLYAVSAGTRSTPFEDEWRRHQELLGARDLRAADRPGHRSGDAGRAAAIRGHRPKPRSRTTSRRESSLQWHACRVFRDPRPSHLGRADLYARRSRGPGAGGGRQPVTGAGVLARPVAARPDAAAGDPVPQIPASRTRPVVIGVVADAITARLHERSAFAVYEPLDPANERFGAAPDTGGARHDGCDRSREPAAARDRSAGRRQDHERCRAAAAGGGPAAHAGHAHRHCRHRRHRPVRHRSLRPDRVGRRPADARDGRARRDGRGPRDLLRLLMWDSLRPVVIGLAVGAGAALLASRVVVASMFFGVSPQDPIAFAGAAVILLAAATLAVLVPTRRAASVDAAFVLRRS